MQTESMREAVALGHSSNVLSGVHIEALVKNVSISLIWQNDCQDHRLSVFRRNHLQ